MAEERLFWDIQVTSSDIEVRKIGVSDLWQSLKQGVADFNAKPSIGLFLVLIYPLFALLVTVVVVSDDLLYLGFPIMAGLTLLGPMISVALFEMSRRRERGLEPNWRSAFGFIHSSAFAPIAALSIVMMCLYLGWLFMAEIIYFGTFGATPPESMADFFNQLTTTRHGHGLIIYGNGVGFLFACAALAISVVAFPLLLDKPTTSLTAISVSMRAFAANIPVMALWGLIVVALLAFGAVFFLIGLVAVLPILGHATWHLYRKLVVA
jgi:uncharacterized membrane protein